MKELSVKERRAVSRKLAREYQKASKKEKGRLLDTLVRVAGYNRCYASWMLRNFWRRVKVERHGGKVEVFVGDPGRVAGRGRGKTYTEDVLGVLRQIWKVCGFTTSTVQFDCLVHLRCSLLRAGSKLRAM